MKLLLIAFLVLLIQGAVFGLTRKHHKVENLEMKEAAVAPEAKRSWPHLTGLAFSDVEQKVKADRPDVHIYRMKQNAVMTMDYREDRVRIFVDDEGKVVGHPMVG